MGRLLKITLLLIGGIAGIVVIAAIALILFFDPNDFRDRISATVKEKTGRDLVVGDISLSVFPWLAVELGRTELGNAEGFDGDEFLSFEQASLSVKIMPLLLSQQVEVGTAALDGLNVNLQVAADGTTNWDDLAEGGDAGADDGDIDREGATGEFDVASIAITNASINYADAAAGSTYRISNLTFETGRIATETPIDINAGFDLAMTPGELGGSIALRGTTTFSDDLARLSVDGLNISGALDGVIDGPAEFNFDARAIQLDTAAQSIDPGEIDLMALDLAMAMDVEPFSYAGTPQPVADLRVAPFSLKALMQTVGVEPPVTADPDALENVSFSARATVGEDAVALSAMTLELDRSTMTGMMSLPMTATGALGFDLEVDRIVLDGYMAPADESAASSSDEGSDVEIPTDLIRALNVNGSFRVREASLTGMEFSDLEVGVNADGGRLRLNPLVAKFYDGGYAGDVQIDASQSVPFISVDERIADVNLGAMMKALYDVDDVTGTVSGHFRLQGAGPTLSVIRQDLDGTMSFELADGAWEGTDVWHQLRTARALFRQEPPPEPTLPVRTEFTAVSATGQVQDGVFSNNDFFAELPFLQLNGGGTVDLNSTEVDYALDVRVLERPEFMAGATEAEVADFTETVVPLKITGLLASPSVRPDLEGIFRARVEQELDKQKDELRDKLLERLLGEPEQAPEEGAAGEGADLEAEDGERAGEQAEAPAEEDPEDILKRELLRKLFEN
jgi:AsmA protein